MGEGPPHRPVVRNRQGLYWAVRLYEFLVRPLAFLLAPEAAHNLALSLISRGLVAAKPFEHPLLRQTLFGHEFLNPLGLAAGFDKNAVAVDRWHQLGFGFAEIGTVTALAQPGNEKPRLFRIPENQALINRMGFNNVGADAVAARVGEARPKIPIGINIGKSKLTELENATEDYRASFLALRPFGAYFVVNVSSPNTAGLRSLQEKGPLGEILAALKEIDSEMPLFVKVSPDLELSALDDVIKVCQEHFLTGIVATNTALSREGISSSEAGGLSGKPLQARSNKVIAHIRSSAPDLAIIGVGGIFTAADLYDKIKAGAHLAQVYTGWVYGGPSLVPRLLREFTTRLKGEGIRSLAELRGS